MRVRMVAPWDVEQVRNLNDYQLWSEDQPFVCGALDHDWRKDGVLRATCVGWVCRCGFSQLWAYEFMVDGSWRHSSDFW